MTSPSVLHSNPGAVSRRRRVVFSLTLLALLAGAALLLIELGLRLAGPWLPEPLRSSLEEAGRIGFSNTRTFNGILLPPLSDTDILVVGDSFPWGTYVRVPDAFPAKLEAALHRRVTNLGIGSTSPPEYNRMVEVGARYHPQLVIYCIFANDFNTTYADASRPLHTAKAESAEAGDAGLFEREPNWRRRLQIFRRRITNLFISFQYLKLLAQPVYKNQDRFSQRINGRPFVFAGRSFWDPAVSATNSQVQASIKQNVQLAARVQEFGRETGFKLLVVLLPSKEMVYGPLVANAEAVYSEDHHRTYQVLAEELGRQGITCLDLTSPLRQAARDGEPLYFAIDGHFDEGGHHRTAQLLADYLRARPELLSSDKSRVSP
jgi:hypothetical protein